jgi:hypothetical protein
MLTMGPLGHTFRMTLALRLRDPVREPIRIVRRNRFIGNHARVLTVDPVSDHRMVDEPSRR